MGFSKFVARLSKKRRITIPKVIVADLGLKEGHCLLLEIKGVGKDSLEAVLAAVEKEKKKVK